MLQNKFCYRNFETLDLTGFLNDVSSLTEKEN